MREYCERLPARLFTIGICFSLLVALAIEDTRGG